jgi:hypothetical protein
MSRRHAWASAGGATLSVEVTDMDRRRTRYLTDSHGKRTAVVLPITEYERLLEDMHDLAVVAERRPEPTVDAEELKRRLDEGASV